MSRIKVLVVDDSVIFRTAFKKILTQPDIEVVGTASNGKQAVEMNNELKPDIITMDIEMPLMNGLDATKLIMQQRPTKILLVSSLTSDGAEETMKGLSYGALDFVHKINRFGNQSEITTEVLNKIRQISASTTRLKRISSGSQSVENKSSKSGKEDQRFTDKAYPSPSKLKLITIGISTGGPNTLAELIPALKSDIQLPIVIVQHMPPTFTKSLADRLDSKSELHVVEATDSMKLEAGTVYIAPGGRQTRITRMRLYVNDQTPEDEVYTPSYNVLLESYKDEPTAILPIVMTGMGGDGTRELKKLSSRGTFVIAQSPDSCVISGMPKTAIEAGAVDVSFHLDDFPSALNKIVNGR